MNHLFLTMSIAFLLCLGLFIHDSMKDGISNRFQIGDCVISNIKYESWEVVSTYKILEVGKNNYRICLIREDGSCNTTSRSSLSFYHPLVKVKCL